MPRSSRAHNLRDAPPLGWRLVVAAAHGDERELLFSRSAVVGRAIDADLVLDDPGVAARHVRVEVVGDVVLATDLGSDQGTYLNGSRFVGSTNLRSGDVLGVGGVDLRLEDATTAVSVDALRRPRFGRGRARTVLVSSAPTDSAAADFLVFQLQRAGHLSVLDRSSDDAWGGGLLDALWRSDAVVVVVSPGAAGNGRVRREVLAAGAEGVPLVTLVIEPTDFEPDMAFYLLQRRPIDLRFDAQRGAVELLALLDALPRRLIRRPRWFASRVVLLAFSATALGLFLRWLFAW